MKLAEALMLRADLNRRAQELRGRIKRNATYQEGDTPAEDPTELLQEFEGLMGQFERIVIQINQTNLQAPLESGERLVEALARRDVLKLRHQLYKELAAEATPKQDRYSKKEIRYLSAVPVKEIQAEADVIAKAYRELDAQIQAANWRHDLLE